MDDSLLHSLSRSVQYRFGWIRRDIEVENPVAFFFDKVMVSFLSFRVFVKYLLILLVLRGPMIWKKKSLFFFIVRLRCLSFWSDEWEGGPTGTASVVDMIRLSGGYQLTTGMCTVSTGRMVKHSYSFIKKMKIMKIRHCFHSIFTSNLAEVKFEEIQNISDWVLVLFSFGQVVWPEFWGESFWPSWCGSFRAHFRGGPFRPDFWGESFRPDLCSEWA